MAKYNEKQMINDLRMLSLDMINKAKNGDPGVCLSLAPVLYSLFANHLVYDLEKPDWINRDRLVVSNGQMSALLYATLVVTTEDYSIEDLQKFTKINSQTPETPELDINKRIEFTSSLPGQGLATSVGLAISEKYLESKYNNKKTTLFDYKTYCLCSDNDLMEGISYEAASIAGQNKLNNLIVIYESNNITQSTTLPDNHSDIIADVYASLEWNVLVINDSEKIGDIDKAFEEAKRSKKPTLIIINNILGKYSLVENTNQAHNYLEEKDLEQIREKLKGKDPFEINEENLLGFKKIIKTRNHLSYSDWEENYKKYISNLNPEEIEKLNEYINKENVVVDLEKVIDQDKIFKDKTMRDINYQIINVISAFLDNFLGCSADSSNQTKAYLKNGKNYNSQNYTGKNIELGNRENAMGAILNGIALSGFMCFGSTYLVNADNMKSSIRSSAIMNLPVTYIFTHDSITMGEKGKSYQPVEQLAMLRSIPNLDVYRPCDYKELIGAWKLIISRKKPAALIISKDETESYKFTSIEEVSYGGYVISEVKTRLDVILIASGSEVTLAMTLKHELLKNFIEARVVSMPNINEFFKQSPEYQNQVLPKGYKRMVVEFSNDPTMYRLVKTEDDIINVSNYGKSGTKEELLNDFELDIQSIIIKIKNNI